MADLNERQFGARRSSKVEVHGNRAANHEILQFGSHKDANDFLRSPVARNNAPLQYKKAKRRK
jgi:hypothetical protein